MPWPSVARRADAARRSRRADVKFGEAIRFLKIFRPIFYSRIVSFTRADVGTTLHPVSITRTRS